MMVLPRPSKDNIVLVGLMGAGKSSVGRRLAQKLDLPFTDADDEIVRAAGCSIEDIFALYGETAFRDGERRVIARILDCGPQVLATGGGAFIDPDTRERIKERSISVWLRAEVDVLYERTRRRTSRPLLNNDDPRGTLERFIEQRYPVYAEADVVVDTAEEGPEMTTKRVLNGLRAFNPCFPIKTDSDP